MDGYGGYGNADDGGYGNSGGYMQGGAGATSPGQPGDKKGMLKSKTSTVVPVTLQQLFGARVVTPGDQHPTLDGKLLQYARVLGRVVSATDDASYCEMTVYDGTTEAKKLKYYNEGTTFWLQQRSEWEHSLCDIVINCKTTGTEVKPNVVSCKAVSDHNLVTHHMLDVLNHHLMQTQGPLPRGGSAGAPGAGSGAFQSSSTQVAQAAILAHGIHGGGDSEIDWVLNVFKEIGTTTGDVSVDDVVSRAVQEGRRLDRARVAAFAERLMMDGHIYSTSDENHFMPSA